MSLDQLKAFLARMQSDAALKDQVLAAATADDVAQIGLKLGFEFSGDELLRVSGQRFDRVTVRKNDIPRYNNCSLGLPGARAAGLTTARRMGRSLYNNHKTPMHRNSN